MLYITIRYISWFMISMNELLLVYFICILDYGYDVRQKVNSSDFFFIQIQTGSQSSRDNLKHQQCIWLRNC